MPRTECGNDGLFPAISSAEALSAADTANYGSVTTDTDQDTFDLMFQTMPYEVSEPVMWSAQFVDAAYNPFLTRSYSGFDG